MAPESEFLAEKSAAPGSLSRRHILCSLREIFASLQIWIFLCHRRGFQFLHRYKRTSIVVFGHHDGRRHEDKETTINRCQSNRSNHECISRINSSTHQNHRQAVLCPNITVEVNFSCCLSVLSPAINFMVMAIAELRLAAGSFTTDTDRHLTLFLALPTSSC